MAGSNNSSGGDDTYARGRATQAINRAASLERCLKATFAVLDAQRPTGRVRRLQEDLRRTLQEEGILDE